MADAKISELAAGAPALNGDQIPINRSGSNFRLTVANIQGSGVHKETVAVSANQAFIDVTHSLNNASHFVTGVTASWGTAFWFSAKALNSVRINFTSTPTGAGTVDVRIEV